MERHLDGPFSSMVDSHTAWIWYHSCGGTILQGLQNVITKCLLLHQVLPKIKLSILEEFSVVQNGKF
jgi:hypothetical protein